MGIRKISKTMVLKTVPHVPDRFKTVYTPLARANQIVQFRTLHSDRQSDLSHLDTIHSPMCIGLLYTCCYTVWHIIRKSRNNVDNSYREVPHFVKEGLNNLRIF